MLSLNGAKIDIFPLRSRKLSGRLTHCAVNALCAVMLAGASSTAAQAQVAPEPQPQVNDGGSLQEIVVTAQKRSQNIRDVGMSIATASAAQLQTAGVTDVAQLGKIAPGFTAAKTFLGNVSFSVRGINLYSAQVSAPPAVSVYVDQLPLPYSGLTESVFLDVERVEVLKGPQGTLFGQNATGGSVNVVAAKPTAVMSAGLKGEVNHFGQVMLEGFVSGPIASTLNARLAVQTTQFGAWQRGYTADTKGLRNGDEDRAAARLLLDWTPTDRITVALNFNGSYNHSEPQRPQFHGPQLTVPANAAPGLIDFPRPNDSRDVAFDNILPRRQKNYQYQVGGRLDYDISDNVELSYLASYIKNRLDFWQDVDYTTAVVGRLRVFGDIKSFFQEVRLTGKVPEAGINYILGANYQRDSLIDNQSPDELIHLDGLPPNTTIFTEFAIKNKATGIYGNADYEVVPGLTLTGGARYTWNSQRERGCNRDNGNLSAVTSFVSNAIFRAAAGLPPTDAFAAGNCATIDDTGPNPQYLPAFTDQLQKEKNFSFRGGINYKLSSGVMVYGLISRGYKAGLMPVLTAIFQSQLNPVSQERLTNYEAGAKLSLLDRRLNLNVSAFHYDYRNKQFYTFVPVPPIGVATTIVNIPKSTVKGIDLDFEALPMDGLTLRGGVTYIKTKVGEFISFDNFGAQQQLKGSEFNFAPPWSGTFDAEYRAAVSQDLQGYLGGSVLFNSRAYSDLGENPVTRLTSYALVDARIGVESDKGWRLGLWVRNLTDKYYWTAITAGVNAQGKFAGMPRTWGASFGVRF